MQGILFFSQASLDFIVQKHSLTQNESSFFLKLKSSTKKHIP